MAITRRRFLRRSGLAAAALPFAASLPGCLRRMPSGVRCSDTHTFHNWSHTIRFEPGLYCEPETEEQVVAIVKEAVAKGTRVRTQGAGHSFSQLLATPDTLLSLDALKRPMKVDGTRVTVAGGMRLKHLIPALAREGLALKNMGSITEQSIAGAFSTGTHGSGLRLGAIPTQVVGLRLVDGTGEVRTIGENDPDLKAARINLGALGIITEVTLDCVKHYQLEYTASVGRFDEVVARIDELNRDNDRVVIWWPLLKDGLWRDKVVLITKNAVPASGAKAPLVKVGKKRLPMNPAALVAAGGAAPSTGLKVIRHVVEDYDQVLTIPLLPVFHRECEYAIPVENTAEALRQFRRVVDEHDFALDLPVEVRFVARDDILLSPAHGRDVCYIGASTLLNSTEVFERFEPIMKALGGRSHWGKNFTLTRDEVAAKWPTTYAAFGDVRKRYDPAGVFRNVLLEELFP
jgi:FAD/FMN-containing dehydrogenase